MLINLRNALMAGKRLPYDAEVEYLESTGTQWIDNVYTYTGNESSIQFKSTFEVPQNASKEQYFVFGGYVYSRFPRIFILDRNGLQMRATCDGGSSTTISTAAFSTVYTVDATFSSNNTLKASVNGSAETTYTRNFYAPQGATATVFQSGLSSQYNLFGRIYSLQILIDGILVRDYIPVRKGAVGYLYDRVSGKLFGNAGTGAFAYGNDV